MPFQHPGRDLCLGGREVPDTDRELSDRQIRGGCINVSDQEQEEQGEVHARDCTVPGLQPRYGLHERPAVRHKVLLWVAL